jgi:hypothetical protein
VYARSKKEREAEEEMGLKARWLSLGSELAAATPRAIPSLSRDVPSTVNGQWTMVHGCACLITEQKQKKASRYSRQSGLGTPLSEAAGRTPPPLLLARLVLGSLSENVLALERLLDLDAALAGVTLAAGLLPGRAPGRRPVLAMAELGLLGRIARRLRREVVGCRLLGGGLGLVRVVLQTAKRGCQTTCAS